MTYYRHYDDCETVSTSNPSYDSVGYVNPVYKGK